MNEHKESKFIIDVSSQAKVLNRSTTRFFSYDSHTAEIVIQAEKDGKLIDQALVDTVEIYFESVNNQYLPTKKLKWNDIMEIGTDGLYSYILPDDFLNYEGLLAFDVYINYKNGDKADSSNRIIFEQRISAIDRAAGAVELVYIKDMETAKRKITEQATEITENFLREWNAFEAGSTAKMQELDQRIDEQTEIFNNADVYNKAEIEDKLEPFALQTDIAEVSAQLAEKPQYEEVRLKSEKLQLEDASEEFLGAMSGNATFNLLSIPQDKSVSVEKTDFVKLEKNLFDKYNLLPGKLFYYVNGTLNDSANYSSTKNYVPIEPNTTYYRTESSVIIFYDADKNFISGVTFAGGTFTSPTNASYFKASIQTIKSDLVQIEKGSVGTSVEPFALNIDHLKVNLDKDNVDTPNYKNHSITPEKLSFTAPVASATKNLFNKKTASIGYYVNNTNGNLNAHSSYASSDYIPVKPSTQYIETFGYYLAFYDSNKVYISGLSLAADVNIPRTLTTPANASYIRISVTAARIDTMMLVEGTVLGDYEPFGYTLPDLIDTSMLENPVILNLPSKLYGVIGQELNIYFDNIVSGHDYDYDFDVVCGKGRQYQNFWRFVPDAAETRPITINVYKDNILVVSASSNIICKAATVGSGVTKKIIKIGDSTTDNGNGIVKLVENFNADVMDITAIGTRGTSPNLHEGRAGWTATDYCTISDRTGVVNAFWNSTTSKFDFSYYMTNNALAVPDYVFINLGINDMFNPTDDTALKTTITNAIARYDEMITSIKAYNSNIKIALGLTIPPNYSQDAFGKAYYSVQNRNRYKRNHDLWVKKLIDTYDNREAENIYVVPIHTNLDTRYNMGLEETQVNARNTATFTSPIGNGGVHPVESGYWQIADVEWYFLKSFES